MLETFDDHGFDLMNRQCSIIEFVLVRLRFQEEAYLYPIQPHSVTSFSDKLSDLTDAGATTLLPSYTVDVWSLPWFISKSIWHYWKFSDWAIASWPALLGPSIDLDNEANSFSWDDPSPVAEQAVNLEFEVLNTGGKGDVAFVLQRSVEGGFWQNTARVDLVAGAGGTLTGSLLPVANAAVGESIEFRLLVWLMVSKWIVNQWTLS